MRRRQNWIESIRDESRCSHNSRNSIAKVFLDKFQDLFFGVLKRNVEEVQSLITPQISREDNEELILIPSREETRRTVWSMNPWKAPSPDGFSGIFFQHY